MNFIKKPFQARTIGISLLLLLAASIPLSMYLSSQQQDTREYAATICEENTPVDIVMLFDRSGSMKLATSATDSTTRMVRAQSAAKQFVSLIQEQRRTPSTQIGLIAVADEETTVKASGLTTNYNNVRNAIDAMSIESWTCIECAAKMANDELRAKGRTNGKKVAILLTDGEANRYILDGIPPDGNGTRETTIEAEKRALAEAIRGYNEQGITYYAIGFGEKDVPDGIREQLLRDITSQTGGRYIYVPTANELESAFEEVANEIGSGSISGFKYHDEDENGLSHANEKRLANWKIELRDSERNLLSSTLTNADGQYLFDGLCSGTYRISEELKSGWKKISPSTEHVVRIENGQSVANINFGNTTIDGGTKYTITGTIFIDDNANGLKDSDEPYYSGPPLTPSAFEDRYGDPPVISGHTFTFADRKAGLHIIRFFDPSGNIVKPQSYAIDFHNSGYTCVSSGASQPACRSGSGTTVVVNFGIVRSDIWIQAYGLNARFDKRLPMQKIPASADSTYGLAALKSFGASFSAPGVLITGATNIDLSPGSVSESPYNWKVGSDKYPDLWREASFPLASSFKNLSQKLKNEGEELRDAQGGCNNYANCTLKNNLKPGIYKVSGSDLTLNTFTFRKQSVGGVDTVKGDYVFLVDGALTLAGPIEVSGGTTDRRTLVFSVKNDIIMHETIGRAPGEYSSARAADPSIKGLEGIYVADRNIILSSFGSCGEREAEDLQLFVDGALIMNAAGKGGNLEIERTLCADNTKYPTLIVRPRLDIILSLPSRVRQETNIWKELAP
jgi:Mg-chelatase subunit ChlD